MNNLEELRKDIYDDLVDDLLMYLAFKDSKSIEAACNALTEKVMKHVEYHLKPYLYDSKMMNSKGKSYDK